MSERSRENKFAATLLYRICKYYSVPNHGLDDIEANEFQSFFELFNFWSYVAVSHILKDEAEYILANVQVEVSEIDETETNFRALAEAYLKNPDGKMKSSLDFYRLCIKLSTLAILFKLQGCESALTLCEGYLEKLTVVAWENGYVDGRYDESRNFAADLVDHVLKSLNLNVKKYSNLLRMLVFDPNLRIYEHEKAINKLIIENKPLLESLKKEYPEMNEELFARKFIRFLKEYRKKPSSLASFLELLVKTALLNAHSVQVGYKLAVFQAAEYITTSTVLAKRVNII